MSLADKPVAAAQRAEVADRLPVRAADVLLRWESILIVLLVAVFIGNALATPWFLDVFNLADAT